MKKFKRILLTGASLVLMGQAQAFDSSRDAPSDHWKHNHRSGGYCEEIYWEDEYNCLYPEREVTLKFCMNEKLDEARTVCLRKLKKQTEKNEIQQ